MTKHHTRRFFLSGVSLAAAGCLVPNKRTEGQQAENISSAGHPEDISPAEDLMREHGLLNRVLLIYDEVIRRLHAKVEFDPRTLTGAAEIIRHFIEDYHEKLEENYLFPRFEKAGHLTDLVKVLREQHQAGRNLTAQILRLAASPAAQPSNPSHELTGALHAFVRMYRPHEAREDTVLFPALHKIVSANEYDALGDEFEKKEHELFGHDGFEEMVGRVAKLEKALGVYDLSKVTPR